MTQKTRLIYACVLLAGTIFLAATYVFLRVHSTDASEQELRGNAVWQTSINADLDRDGTLNKIYLTSYQSPNGFRSFVSVRDGWLRTREKELVGFEEDLAFCPTQYFASGQDMIMCIFGEVGVHSENVQFIRYSDFSYLPIVAEDGKVRENMSCDAPNFMLEVDETGSATVYFDSRDYNQDPLVDIVRSHYYLDNGFFKFQSSEQIFQEGFIK